MVSFGFINILFILSCLLHDALSLSNEKAPRFSLSEQAMLSQGEASLFGSSNSYSTQPLWSGNKKTKITMTPFGGNEDKSLSFTPRTKPNQSSFVAKKARCDYNQYQFKVKTQTLSESFESWVVRARVAVWKEHNTYPLRREKPERNTYTTQLPSEGKIFQ